MTENKLLVLLALKTLGATEEQQLWRFMVECDLMDYIEYSLCRADLDEAGMLRTFIDDQGQRLGLSNTGLETLSMFESRIPPSLRERIEEKGARARAQFRNESSVLSDFQEDDAGYTVRLRLKEEALTLMDLRVNVPTRAQAQAFCEHFNARASELYAMMMRTLGEE
jgi:hypothetical protein